MLWAVDLAEQALRLALPSGLVFLRALIDEGGTATAARLKDLTGSGTLHRMTQTLNGAAKKAAGRRSLGGYRHLAHPRRDPNNPRKATIYDYELPDDLVPIFDDALRRLDG